VEVAKMVVADRVLDELAELYEAVVDEQLEVIVLGKAG
jgi:hypothetical protein